MAKKKWTPKEDAAWDKAHGVNEDSKRDRMLDHERGIKENNEQRKPKK